MTNQFATEFVSFSDLVQILEKKGIWDDGQTQQIKKALSNAILQSQLPAFYEQVTHRSQRMSYSYSINIEVDRRRTPVREAIAATTAMREVFNDKDCNPNVLRMIVLSKSELDAWLSEYLATDHPLPKRPPPVTPPGYLGRNEITKLAIKAAWEIECQTSDRASPQEVMRLLYTWAEDKVECLKSANRAKRLVIWQTTKLDLAEFTLEACGKALVRWHESREG
ncbi:hypothetical protein HNQ50_000309 [Silvimonas terrae]|uniref:Uncharacterized protein n=1 Tax=Silvimonas terrae TaxID=300266 RepID=A0A840R8D0_9NEIS|nr:hypothetical protein [Silvimonas terrae]MBB5189599.1 hypothetical protein [Silvimonas terrae]